MRSEKLVSSPLRVLRAGIGTGQRRLKGVMIDALGVSNAPVNPAPPDRPSIAVLPFMNASGDPARDYVGEGFTEDLTSALGLTSRYLFVISMESAFAYRDPEVDPRKVGLELGVRYVLRGTVSVDGTEVTVRAQLIDASSGGELWAEKYERPLADVQMLQAEITESILVAVGAGVEAAELERLAARPIANVGAVEAVWGGCYHLRQVTRADLVRARDLLEHAIELDPDLVNAYAFLAGTFTQEFSNGWSRDATLLERADGLARQAVATDDRSSAAWAILGIVHILREEWEDAIRCEDRAIELEPNVMWPYALRGMALAEGRKWMEATKSIKRALRLAPVAAHGLLMMLAYTNYGAGRRDEAVELLEEVRTGNHDNILVRVALAAFYTRRGDVDEAKRCVDEILAINPDMTVEWAMDLIPGLRNVAGRREFEEYPHNLHISGLPLESVAG